MISPSSKAKKTSVMANLLADHEELLTMPTIGDIVTGHILDKSRNTMYLDLGPFGVGIIYSRELIDDLDTYKKSKIGDPVQATIQEIENDEGYVELSLRSASRERSWAEIKRKLESNDIFSTEIIDANKGGLIVRVNGIMGFLPVSQLAPDHYPRVEGGDKNQILDRLNEYTGDKFKVKLITADQDDEKVIVSEKAAIGDELSETLSKLSKDATVSGTISGVADFGAFIKFELDGKKLEGLVHISELAWQRIDNPSDIVQPGDKVEAKIIGIDGLRISLSIKQLRHDPWSDVLDKFSIGDKVSGEVLKVTPFGGFIKLNADIHGLVHISELPESAQSDPESLLKPGEMVEFEIISLDPKEHRLGLSIKSLSSKKRLAEKLKMEIPKKPNLKKTASKKTVSKPKNNK